MAVVLDKVRKSRFMLSHYNKQQSKCAREVLHGVKTIGEAVDAILAEGVGKKDVLKFLEDYEFVDAIASGASAVVLKAKSILSKQIVAIKLMEIDGKSQRKDCAREIEIHSSLEHQNVVKLLDWFMTDDFAVLVEEFIPETLLSLTFGQTDNLPDDTKRFLLKQVVEGLEYIHSKGVVHLDLKLDNILVTNTGVAKICDFGLAHWEKEMPKVKDSMQKRNKRLTKALGKKAPHVFLGTPLYASPESVQNELVSSKSDMWSLGVLCFLLLGEYFPFGTNDSNVAEDILQSHFTFYSLQWRSHSLPSRDFVSNLLRANVQKRFSAKEALKHLWLDSEIPIPVMFEQSLEADEVELVESTDNNSRHQLSRMTSLAFVFLGRTVTCKAVDVMEKCLDGVFRHFKSAKKSKRVLATTEECLKSKPRKLVKKQKKKRKESVSASWVDDKEVHFCRLCDERFYFLRRRHHCRSCGQIICGSCSNSKRDGNRTCDLCCLDSSI